VRRVSYSRTTKKSKQRIATSQPAYKMKTTDEYKAAISDAKAFKHENPNEKAITAA
jgi:hypothetical protein